MIYSIKKAIPIFSGESELHNLLPCTNSVTSSTTLEIIVF